MLKLAKRCCNQCLTTRNRIVSGKRAAEIIRDCRREGNHFICHKAEGEIVHCRGVHDRFGSNAARFAEAVGIPIEEVDMDKPTMTEPDADAPLNLMSDISAMIFNHYIGQSSSRIKAEKLAEKILVHLTAHYEDATARIAAEEAEQPIAPENQTR